MVLILMICCLIFVQTTCGTNTENVNSITVDDNDFVKLNEILLNNHEYIQLISELRHSGPRSKRENKRAPSATSSSPASSSAAPSPTPSTTASTSAEIAAASNLRAGKPKLPASTTANYSGTKKQQGTTETPVKSTTPRRPNNRNSKRTRTTKSTLAPNRLSTSATAASKPATKDKNKESKPPTKYHHYPHNQHMYLLPECAIQQVCNAVYVRLNYTQPLCACSPRYRDPCSASLNEDDNHTIKLIGNQNKQAITLAKTCEKTEELRDCRPPKDWSILALQNTRTGKSHYLVICKCPSNYRLEGPLAHDQPTYAGLPGINVYGMLCVPPEASIKNQSNKWKNSNKNRLPPIQQSYRSSNLTTNH